MPRFLDSLKRLLAGEPWSERRARERRARDDRRESSDPDRVVEDRRVGERRRADRRGRGWFRFWNPP